jgi:hypothetical protein
MLETDIEAWKDGCTKDSVYGKAGFRTDWCLPLNFLLQALEQLV